MEWILLLVGIGAIIFLFVSNGRMRGEIDRLQSDGKVVASNLDRLTKLYETLLAARHAPPAAEPIPTTATPPQPAAAPVPPSVAEAAAPSEMPADESPAWAEPPPTPEQVSAPEELLGDIPPQFRDEPEPAAAAMAPPPPPAPPSPPKRFEWERFLGVRLPIWIGAVALCIAGFFFVSYAIESGLFGPEFRVLAGVAAGLAFLAGAEFIRRRARTENSANIAAALASAAIATFYATAYIASVTYGLISETFGFVAMAGVTALAIFIALTFGQAVALVGLFGGYLTPALFASDSPSALFLFGYLTAVHIAIFAIIRLRSWWHLTLPALLGPLLWIALWLRAPGFETQPMPAALFLIALPVVVVLAAFESWRDDAEPLWFVGGTKGWPRRAVPLATALAALGFLAFLNASGHALGFWQGLIGLSVIAVAASFLRPNALGYLQVLPLIATIAALLIWRASDGGGIAIITAVSAAIFGFGALDQLRRLQRPALGASAVAFVALAFFMIGLFKVAGWESALTQKHFWAGSALALAAALMALLWSFGPRVAEEKERSRVYAALAGAVTTFVSLAVVLEVDPVLFPAASAVAVLGLAAVHSRVPVRGLRILAGVYATIYALLILGAGGGVAAASPGMNFVLAKSLEDAPFVLLILPGLAFFGASLLFSRHPLPQGAPDALCTGLDIAAVAALATGLVHLLVPEFMFSFHSQSLIVAARIAGPEALLAAAAVFAGGRFLRQPLYFAGIVLAVIVSLAMLLRLMLPVLEFWPTFEVPGFWIFDVALAALGLPALVLLGIGWFVQQDARPGVANTGRAISVFAAFALYALLLIEIREGFHPDRLQGPMGVAENYIYSAATLIFGILLLVVGVIIRNRGARALSLAFVLAAMGKVFVFDAASLEGLWRVASFLGLGLCLLAISWAYARYVFGIGRTKPPPPDTGPEATPA